MRASVQGVGRNTTALHGRWYRATRRPALVIFAAACLLVLPADFRSSGTFDNLTIGPSDAWAQPSDIGRGGRGAERSARPDPDTSRSAAPDRDRSGSGRDRGRSDREDRGGPEDRGASSRGVGGRGGASRDVDRSVTTPDSPAAAAMARALGQRDGEPANAPTDSDTARVRAMVEIARDLGAAVPPRGEEPRISGAVTQEMLDQAEKRYVEAVQEAWEAHGFPWNDSEVLQALDELDALVSALENIMRDVDGGSEGARVATDVNNDGFVDINDLWDAHLR